MGQNGYPYGDWLSCPECESSEIYIETIQRLKRDMPPGTDGLQAWLRFHCEACDYRSREYSASDVLPEYER